MHHQLFGVHTPTGSWLHRLPALPKLVLLSATILTVVLLRRLPFSLGLLTLALVLLLVSRVPWRRAFVVAPGFLLMVAAVSSYPLFFGDPWRAPITFANLLGALYLGRVLTLTTPMMDLVDGLVRLAKPLDWVGIGAERFGLAAMVMLRSVPYLADSFGRVGEATRARGIERNIFARVTPVVVDAVAYAQRTGEAMVARGLGDPAEREAPTHQPR